MTVSPKQTLTQVQRMLPASRRPPVRHTLDFAAAAKVRSGEAAPQRLTPSAKAAMGRLFVRFVLDLELLKAGICTPNRWKRWSDMGVFARIMTGLAAEAPDNKTISIDATYLKAHRKASSMGIKKGTLTSDRADQGWYEHQVACRHGYQWSPNPVLYNGGSG